MSLTSGTILHNTAWLMLHKLRRAMVNTAREPLHGEIEIDDTWVDGPQAGLRGSRQLKGRRAALVLVGVEKRAHASGRSQAFWTISDDPIGTRGQAPQFGQHISGPGGLILESEKLPL